MVKEEQEKRKGYNKKSKFHIFMKEKVVIKENIENEHVRKIIQISDAVLSVFLTV